MIITIIMFMIRINEIIITNMIISINIKIRIIDIISDIINYDDY